MDGLAVSGGSPGAAREPFADRRVTDLFFTVIERG